MKKTVTVILALAMAALLLAGCMSSLPEGFDDQAVSLAADNAIKAFNAKDFEGLIALFEESRQDQLTPEMWEENFGAILDKKGAFVQFEKVNMMGTADEETGEEFAYVEAVAKYENGTLAHSLYLDKDGKLVSYQLGVEEGDMPAEASSAASASAAE